MSAIIPGCDSDEEVFWGPVTARELELIWRSRMANKKEGESTNPVEKFTKNPEGLNKSSGQNICTVTSNSSVQEVPSLQDLRNSSGNQKMSFDVNDHEHETEDYEHGSVENESTLPLLEASIVINKDHKEIQNVSDSPGGNSNSDDISDQVMLHEHEGHVKCEPESSNQLDDSIENPDFVENIDSVQSKDTEEKINSTVENMNEILETSETHQASDVYTSRTNVSKECCDTSGDQSELCASKISAGLNQSNIENIPPQEVNNEHIVESNDVVVENIGTFRKTNGGDHDGDNVLQELQFENQNDSLDSTGGLKVSHIDKVDESGTDGASESCDEKSFVSLISEGDNCISSSNSHYSSLNQDCPETLIVKNKENEEPLNAQSNQDSIKSKIPVSNQIKSTFLKPARLHHTQGAGNEKWLNDLKRKKTPKPKKPEYMVSPAKLGSILKSHNQPMSADKQPVIDAKRSAQPKVGSSTPKPIPGSSRTLLTPRKKQFEFIKSPISEYIRTGTGISTAKSLPALQSPNKIPVPITVKQTPVRKLPPKFYSSAEKLVIKPGSSSSVLKPTESRVLLTPKIFKHQGRIADSKKPGDINVVTPRAVRKTSLTETSFAALPQSSRELEVSVLEEL